MHEHYYAVIMAGGGGTRLWPLSRQGRPKQVLSLIGERSLFQTAVDRLDGVFPMERIYVVTVEDQAEIMHEQVPQIPAENFLIEPLPRGTASVVGLAATALQAKDPQATMAILTADHVIQNEPGFRSLLQAAYDVAQDDYLVTLGITPTYPSTGYGYIQRGETVGTYRDREVYRVEKFTEKPDLPDAKKMLKSGDYAWNSGMFMWRVDRIMNAFQGHMPQLAQALQEIGTDWGTDKEQETLHSVWPEIEPETIDFGVMEKAERVAVLPAGNLGWRDVGSWDALFDILESNPEGNVVRGGEHIQIDTEGALIDTTQSPHPVVTIGTDNIVIIHTGDLLFVCDKKQAQRVREMVQKLREEGREELL